MPVVRMPDGVDVSFPDDMPKEQIKGMIAQKFPDAVPKEKTFTDKAKDFGAELGRQAGLTGRYAVEGVAALPAMVGDLANTGINAAFGTNLEMPSEILSKGLTQAGVPEPRNGLERVIGDASRALAGTGGAVKAAQSISSASPMIQGIANTVAEAPVIQAKAALGSSIASGTTREAGGGPVAQMAAGVAGGMVGASIGKKAPVMTSNDIKAKANQAYAEAAERGGTLKPEFTNKFIDDIQATIPKNEVTRVINTDKEVRSLLDEVKALRDTPLTLEGAQTLDKYIGNLIDGQLKEGRLTEQGTKLLNVQSSLREMIDSVDGNVVDGGKEGFEAVKRGRQLWSAQAKMRDIEKIIARAEMTDNPATSIKTGFRNLYLNDKRMRGFSPEERKAIKKAADSGIVTDVLGIMGSRLGGIISLGAGNNPAVTGAITAGNAVSRGARDKLQLNRANKVGELISSKLTTKPKSKLTPQFLGTAQGISGDK